MTRASHCAKNHSLFSRKTVTLDACNFEIDKLLHAKYCMTDYIITPQDVTKTFTLLEKATS
jgi:hypothetical protein